jgi:hypothetical protein
MAAADGAALGPWGICIQAPATRLPWAFCPPAISDLNSGITSLPGDRLVVAAGHAPASAAWVIVNQPRRIHDQGLAGDRGRPEALRVPAVHRPGSAELDGLRQLGARGQVAGRLTLGLRCQHLADLTGSPVVKLNRTVAVAMTDGPAAGLALLARGSPFQVFVSEISAFPGGRVAAGRHAAWRRQRTA